MHQHGCFRIPVWLRTNVNAVYHDIYFATSLRKLDDAAKDSRAIQSMFSTPLSIEILAPAEIGKPLHRDFLLLRKIERRDDPSAFRFSNRAQILTRIP